MPNSNNSRKHPDIIFRGKTFEVDEDAWVQMAEGDEYEIDIAYCCCNIVVNVGWFEKELGRTEEVVRQSAIDHACAELYLIVIQHEARCPQCQADIVQGLLRPRRPRQEPGLEKDE